MGKLSAYSAAHRLANVDQLFGVIQGGLNWRKSFDAIGGISLFSPGNYDISGDEDDDATENFQDLIDDAEGQTVYLNANKRYRCTDTLTIPHGLAILGPRSATLVIDAANLSNLRITGDDVLMQGFTVEGNQTGVGATPTANAGGHAIAIDGAARTRLIDLAFTKVGLPVGVAVHGNYASPIMAIDAQGLEVQGCYFADSCHNRTGSDVNVSGAGTKILFNVSESACDSFASLSGGEGSLYHKVFGNMAIRGDELSRSAVLVNYGGVDAIFADVSHNDLIGFRWHGVYSPVEITAGRVLVIRNNIQFCGGGNDPAGGAWPGAGTRIQGTGAIVHDNEIGNSGYTPEGVARPNLANGILLLNNARNHSYRGNIIDVSTGPSIQVNNQSSLGELIQDISIEDNTCSGAETEAGIKLSAQVTSAECITDIQLNNNRVTVDAPGVRGVWCHAANGGWFNRVDTDDNKLKYVGGAASTVLGLERVGYSVDSSRYTGTMDNNKIRGFLRGAHVTGSLPTLFCPRAVTQRNNTIENCSEGLVSSGAFFQLHEGTTFRNVTTPITAAIRAGRLKTATNVLMYSDEVPNAGTWAVNDELQLLTPRGPLVGYRCVVAGTPGLWSPVYVDLGYGSSQYVDAAFDSVAIDSRGVNNPALFTGVATLRNWDTNRAYTRTPFVEALETTPSTSAVAGVRSDSLFYSRVGHFYTRLVWAPATGMSVGTRRAFAGMMASTAAPTDVDPSTLTDIIGMGWDDTDTQVQVMYSNTAGPATKVALGASFPRPSADRTLVYSIEIYCNTVGGTPRVLVTELTTGARAAEVFASLANSPIVPLIPYTAWGSVGGTSGVAGVAFRSFRGWREN